MEKNEKLHKYMELIKNVYIILICRLNVLKIEDKKVFKTHLEIVLC